MVLAPDANPCAPCIPLIQIFVAVLGSNPSINLFLYDLVVNTFANGLASGPIAFK